MTKIGITATSANVMKMRRKIGILLKNLIMTTSDPSQTTATHNEIAQANVPFCSVQELQKKWNTTMKVPPKSASSILSCCFKVAMSYSRSPGCLLPNQYAICYNRHAAGMCSGQRLLCAFDGVLVRGIEK